MLRLVAPVQETFTESGCSSAGIHPTIGGVMLGMLTPVRPWFGPSGFAATTQAQLERLPADDRSALLSTLDRINEARQEAVSPIERLIHALHPWVAFVVMPVFALANAGIVLGGASLSGDSLWLFIGIVAAHAWQAARNRSLLAWREQADVCRLPSSSMNTEVPPVS
jgi:Na+/H+ antiporter NhaA